MDWGNDHDLDHRRHRYSLNSRIMLTAIICLFLVVVVIVALHLYARCVLRRRRDAMRQSGVGTAAAQVNSTERPRTGLDAAVIATLPIFVYKGVGEDETNKDNHVECAVCLSNLEKDEMARLLPNCKHTFHSQCIDTWLAVHSTCPICRTEAKPSGQPDQSVESGVVVPATAPPVVEAINSSLPCSVGTSEEQSSKVGGSSTPRLNSFRRILTRERSDRRLQVNDQTDSARDLERQ